MPDYEFQLSEDFLIRPLQESDVSGLFRAIDSNRSILRAWLGWVDSTKSEDDSKKFIVQSIDEFAKGTAYRFGIFHQNILAGIIDFHDVSQAHKKASVGYWLVQECQGQGIMSAALKRLLGFGFDTLCLNRIEIHVAPNNHRSRALPDRSGFKLEGQLRQVEWLYDHFEDHLVFGLLREEWAK